MCKTNPCAWYSEYGGMGKHFAAAVVGLLLPAAIAAADGRGDSNFTPVDTFSYGDKEARERWWPMSGSKPVSVVEIDGRRALRMPVSFKDSRVERASWDGKVALDLTMHKGVQFRVRCRDNSPISHFSFYFRSGGGWYAGEFHAPSRDGWAVVRVLKTATRAEGTPAGWGKVDTVRISAWRSKSADTELHIAEFGLFGSPGKVVVIRGDVGARGDAGEARSVAQFSESMSRLLDRAGLSHAVISDADLTPGRLKGMKVVILPHNPGMQPAAVEQLAAFVKSGGKLVACYTLPRALGELIGIRSGRHVAGKYRGYFSSIRPSGGPLPGAPAEAKQASWNVHEASAIGDRARVAAWWYDDKGKSTGLPAVLASEAGVFLTHVMLADDPQHKGELLMAMVGHLAPALWDEAADGRIAEIGRFEPYDGYAAAVAGIRAEAGGNAAVLAAVATAAKLHDRARSLRAGGKPPQAVVVAGEARAALLDAHCLAQKPAAGEHRAIWCHSAFGVAGMTWDEAVKALADAGMTAVLPNMLWGGVAFYESDVLPVAPDVKARGDQIALCLAACRKYGVQCHVWKVNWNMGSRAPRAFTQRMQADGRTQVSFDSTRNDRWLCPSHPLNRKLEIDAMVEVARKYDVDGVHFDYIRYPGRDGCFCDGCRQRFEKAVGRKVAEWPADARRDAALEAKWLAFRREQITAVVSAVAEQARKARPGVKISAAVFRDWPADRDTIGQDWKLWCEKGWLDFACPMDYTADSGRFGDWVTRQLRWTGNVPCYPGIGLSVWPDRTDVAKLIAQIRIARRLGTKGFTIFNYDPAVAREVLPKMGLGITRPKKR
jgi:uncharacterized lipoprotein YddW (UPF0748 family)